MASTPHRVLHLLLVELKPEVDAAQRERLIAGWGSLAAVPGVAALGAASANAGSTHDLALFAALDDVVAVENFGTDARHMAFLRDHFIPALRGFAGADLFVSELPPRQYGAVLCLLFNTLPGVYDWQVRSLFDALNQEAGPTALCAGTAINSRQRFQAGGVLFFDTEAAASTFISGDRLEGLRTRAITPVVADLSLFWGIPVRSKE